MMDVLEEPRPEARIYKRKKGDFFVYIVIISVKKISMKNMHHLDSSFISPNS